VDGRPNCRNKTAFSNFSSLACSGLMNVFEKFRSRWTISHDSCKRLSRRVEFVMGLWMSQSVSQSVRDVCISHQSDWIYYKHPIKFLFVKVNGL